MSPNEKDLTACYRLFFGREPDASGFSAWAKILHTPNLQPFDLAKGFLGSPEFQSRHPEIMFKETAPELELCKTPAGNFYVPSSDFVTANIRAGTAYEPWVVKLLAKHLKPGDTALDIGANVGYLTVNLANIVGPSGKVFSVEASGFNCKLIAINADANDLKNVIVLHFAAGDVLANVPIESQTVHTNKSVRNFHLSAENFAAYELVTAVPLDIFIDRFDKLKLIKIDIEGYEYKAILGAKGILAKYRPAIFTEYSPNMLVAGSAIDPPEYLQLLASLNYKLNVISHDGTAHPITAAQDPIKLYCDHTGEAAVPHVDLLCLPA